MRTCMFAQMFRANVTTFVVFFLIGAVGALAALLVASNFYPDHGVTPKVMQALSDSRVRSYEPAIRSGMRSVEQTDIGEQANVTTYMIVATSVFNRAARWSDGGYIILLDYSPLTFWLRERWQSRVQGDVDRFVTLRDEHIIMAIDGAPSSGDGKVARLVSSFRDYIRLVLPSGCNDKQTREQFDAASVRLWETMYP